MSYFAAPHGKNGFACHFFMRFLFTSEVKIKDFAFSPTPPAFSQLLIITYDLYHLTRAITLTIISSVLTKYFIENTTLLPSHDRVAKPPGSEVHLEATIVV